MGMDRRRRASLALTLNFLALILAISALTTSYWCEGNRKVVKPFCTGPVTVKQTHCIRYNSSNINDSRLVQYIWETGEDKFVLRKFHTGIWFSCEQNVDLVGEKCRSFINVAPPHERGVLWLCIVAECLYILLLATGGILMSIEVCHFGNVIDGLKLNAFAAIFTVLSGNVLHVGQTWHFKTLYMISILAWSSFTACMASSVTTINRYTKTILEFKHKRRNIEKNLKIKQKLLDLDSPDQVWDMYISSVPSTTEEFLDLSSSGRKLSANSVFLDLNDLPSPQGEEYC
uniref:Gsg1-like 2b n=1 Tax=Cyprinus carpio TaxID=7962 RepID=A0A8C2Q216_CYPCA